MFQFVKALFRSAARHSPRQAAPKARLCVEALEAREVPTSLSVRPVAPVSSLSSLPLSSLSSPTYLPAVQILFPVFIQR
jgi:hypothetical protein